MTFKESEVLSPGNEFSTFETSFGAKIGLGICYDIRFPDLAQIYARDFGCNLLIYPGAFNMTTGFIYFGNMLSIYFGVCSNPLPYNKTYLLTF